MKIVFVSSEVYPFAKTGGLADVAGSLPRELNLLGHTVTVVMPLYREVIQKGFDPQPVKLAAGAYLGNKEHRYNLYYLWHEGMNVYFIDNKFFYDRDGLYSARHGDHSDNAIRFAFFSKAVLTALDDMGGADIIHCNDWQTALVPLYFKRCFNRLGKTVFTIHNIAYQGVFDPASRYYIDIGNDLFTPSGVEYYGKVNFMKGGIIFADAITTVSKAYSREILTPGFGWGLDGLLRWRAPSLFGITNGVDYTEWNPATDTAIVKNYGPQDPEGKLACKKDLLSVFNLPFEEGRPVLGIVTRLTEQKGIDLLMESAKGLIDLGAFLVVLGIGDERYNNFFRGLAARYPGQVGVRIAFDNVCAHKIQAGSDMFLMPSRYEPCGLSQMYSLKYGTVPIVRGTGGLDDTIRHFDPEKGTGNGFKFYDATSHALYETARAAIELYRTKKDQWRILRDNCFASDFSWKRSAEEYSALYEKIAGPIKPAAPKPAAARPAKPKSATIKPEKPATAKPEDPVPDIAEPEKIKPVTAEPEKIKPATAEPEKIKPVTAEPDETERPETE
ncbi:MAG: glycogen synthase GlgA [Candidatus Omnitrophica bacterium]|nr:glycogen synthase GlgA [Candidatus Omnitrophota bacterium]